MRDMTFSGLRCILPALVLTLSARAAEPTFSNPLNPSADPWMVFTGGEYHLATTQGDCVRMWSARSIGGLKDARPVTIWGNGQGVWAPEFHQLTFKGRKKWFCYFTKTDGADERHRMFVMASKTGDITGPYDPPKQIRTDGEDRFYAIDGTVMEFSGQLYFLWAGHPGHRLFISKMKDPMTLEGERVMIPASGFGCEEVREGPYALHHGGRVFLTYSACDTGKPDYKVGVLWAAESSDPMKPESWVQIDTPLLERKDDAGVFGPGHHAFFKSPDGREDWIVYHAKAVVGFTYKGRSTRAQKIEWDADGFPKKIVPLPLDAKVPLPGGDRGW